MSERGVTTAEVLQALNTGEWIETYPDDLPYPSRLVLGWLGTRPLHVVAAEETGTNRTIVVTVYEPVPSRWESGFRKRRAP